ELRAAQALCRQIGIGKAFGGERNVGMLVDAADVAGRTAVPQEEKPRASRLETQTNRRFAQGLVAGAVLRGVVNAHPRPHTIIRLATSSNITSVAPPPIECTRASRTMRSI